MSRPVALALILGAAALSGCAAPIVLSAKARRILLVRNDHHRDDLARVGDAHCDVAYRGAGADDNAINCENALLNQAADMGATVVVVKQMQVTEDSAIMDAELWAPAR